MNQSRPEINRDCGTCLSRRKFILLGAAAAAGVALKLSGLDQAIALAQSGIGRKNGLPIVSPDDFIQELSVGHVNKFQTTGYQRLNGPEIRYWDHPEIYTGNLELLGIMYVPPGNGSAVPGQWERNMQTQFNMLKPKMESEYRNHLDVVFRIHDRTVPGLKEWNVQNYPSISDVFNEIRRLDRIPYSQGGFPEVTPGKLRIFLVALALTQDSLGKGINNITRGGGGNISIGASCFEDMEDLVDIEHWVKVLWHEFVHAAFGGPHSADVAEIVRLPEYRHNNPIDPMSAPVQYSKTIRLVDMHHYNLYLQRMGVDINYTRPNSTKTPDNTLYLPKIEQRRRAFLMQLESFFGSLAA